MGDKLTVDKVFADNLGTAIGGCVRDQSVTLFSSDIARAAGVPWNPIPFFGRAEKTRFRARWAALLQGVGLWAALTAIPELAAEEKLSRKVSSQMQAYTDAILKSPLLEALSEAEVRDYTLLRQRFMRLGASPEASKDAFARSRERARPKPRSNTPAGSRKKSAPPIPSSRSSPTPARRNRSPTNALRRRSPDPQGKERSFQTL